MPKTQLEARDGHVVGIYYTLKNDAGEVVDSNRRGGRPLAYLHGAGNIVKGLEQALTGKRKGDFVEVVVAPIEGYGERDETQVRKVGRRDLPPAMDLAPGLRIERREPDGRMVPGVVRAVDGDEVELDFNHPLAGARLHFEVTIAGVREATEEEQKHGHAHGPGGQRH